MLRAAGVLPPAPTSPLPAAAADPTAGGEGGEWLRRVVDATNTELQTHTDGTQPQHSPYPSPYPSPCPSPQSQLPP